MVELFANHAYTWAEFHDACTSKGGALYNGWMIISLCVYRSEKIPHYAAVWIKDNAGPWVPFYEKDAAGYQEFFDTWTAKGFSPLIVSATGGGVVGNENLGEIFAGVLIKGVSTYANHGMDSNEFKDECASAKKNNFVLRCATIYGGLHRLYAAVWEMPMSRSKIPVKWDYRFFKSMEGPELGVPLTMPENPSLKLSFVTRSPAGEHLAVYRNDYKLDIIERHEMTLRGYSIEEANMEKKKPKYFPWIIQVGADPRFGSDGWNMPNVVAVFRKDEAYW